MTATTSSHTTGRHTVEQPLDETAIAAAAAAYSQRLLVLESRREVALHDAQRRFNDQGLPRGLYRIEDAS